MLTDILIGRSALGADTVDIHRSATFHCSLNAWSRRIAEMFRRS